ncbi:MAG: Uma2 family endonuclease, partial [Thiothrix sp.]
MSAVQKILLSPEEYLAGEALAEFRHEYVAGEVYAMAGASERHNRITLNIAFQLRAKARGSQCGVFMNDMKLRIQQGERFYYPDVMLGCSQEDSHEFYKDKPCLIAEVLSPSTETTDRREKWLAYAQIPSLHYYLLVET